MVKITKVSESSLKPQVTSQRPKLKLHADESIENIVLDSAVYAVSEYGPFMALNFTTDEGEELAFFCGESTVWGRQCIKAFADTIINEATGDISYELKPKFIDRKIWIGMSQPIASKTKKNKTYFELTWGWMDNGNKSGV
jgi:hypothetical protein